MLRRILFIATAALVFISCASERDERKAGHVFVIAFDGWGSYCMDSVAMPNVRALMEAGTYTFDKRTVLPSDSAPNWASMFAGAPNEFHGWSNNGDGPDVKPVYVNANGVFPTIFSILREQVPEAEIGCIFEWGGIRPLIDEKAHNYCVKDRQENLTPLAVEYIKNRKPDFLTVIYDDPDHVGHKYGHDTPEYFAKMEQLDAWLGEILEAIRQTDIYDDSIIIVTSDHGGINTSHGGRSSMEMETPFIVAGKNIRKAGEFSQVMMQYDTAHTIAEMFGLEIPDTWRGKSMSQIFE